MKTFQFANLSKASQKISDRYAYRMVGCAVFLILIATLFPYQFFLQETAERRAAPFPLWLSVTPGSLLDFGKNVLLFVPFGFGLGCWAQKKCWSRFSSLAVVISAGAGLSYAVEFLQVFLPTREPSWQDVVANTIGSLAGHIFFGGCGGSFLCYFSLLEAKVEQSLSIRWVAAIFFSYAAIGLLVSGQLQRASNLSNWERSDTLLLGNDETGRHPWQGRILQVEIFNSALSEELVKGLAAGRSHAEMNDHLVTSYVYSTGPTIENQTKHLPDYSPIPKPSTAELESARVLSDRAWVGTKLPADATLIQELQKTNQFTLRVIYAPAGTLPTTIGRIVSISQGTHDVDLGLSQKGASLTVTFRAVLLGQSEYWAVTVPDVFRNPKPRDITLTFDGSDLLLYVDGRKDPHPLPLNPGATLVHRFKGVGAYNVPGYGVLYDALVFVPLGLLLAFASRKPVLRLSTGRILFGAGMILPPLLLEGVLAGISRRSFSLGNLAFGIGFIAGVFLWFNSDLNNSLHHSLGHTMSARAMAGASGDG